MRSLLRGLFSGIVVWGAACQASTTRPPFGPKPFSATAEVRLDVSGALRLLAASLRQDSIPIGRIEEFDGYLETPWFRVSDHQPTTALPVGPEIIRLRAWSDPAQPGFTRLTVEVVYRPWVDPSRQEREQEMHTAPDHAIAKWLDATLKRFVTQYGDPTADTLHPQEHALPTRLR